MKLKIIKEIGEYKVGDVVSINNIDNTISTKTVPKSGNDNLDYGYRVDRLIANDFAEYELPNN